MQYYKYFPPPHAPSVVLFACSSFESREKGAICCCYLLSMIQSDGEAFRRNIAKLANVACRRWMLVSLAALVSIGYMSWPTSVVLSPLIFSLTGLIFVCPSPQFLICSASIAFQHILCCVQDTAAFHTSRSFVRFVIIHQSVTSESGRTLVLPREAKINKFGCKWRPKQTYQRRRSMPSNSLPTRRNGGLAYRLIMINGFTRTTRCERKYVP